ncbi:hypothetical protein C0993_010200 [Termitomyces sp. T159_Od127]|nr:hypothetical protein C0993_010200 [Termitomyces sp. T159_Od127]
MAYLDDRLFPQFWNDWHHLYRLDDHYPDSPSPPSLPDSDRPVSFSPPPVKQEPDDPGCFIIELEPPHAAASLVSHSLAPPTEVPLRATQASSDMRRMMTVFRLNPFAIHNGVGAVPAQLESAHPLDSEPITFEFQLDIEPGILDPESRPTDSFTNIDLRPFSPDFELHEKPSDPWSAYHDIQELSTSPSPALLPITSWDVTYPDTEDFYPQPVSPRRSSRLHPCTSSLSTLARPSLIFFT